MINIFRFMCHPRIVVFGGTAERGRNARMDTGPEKRDVTMLDEHDFPLLVKDVASVILLMPFQEGPR